MPRGVKGTLRCGARGASGADYFSQHTIREFTSINLPVLPSEAASRWGLRASLRVGALFVRRKKGVGLGIDDLRGGGIVAYWFLDWKVGTYLSALHKSAGALTCGSFGMLRAVH